jgi:hypothetical protein
MAKKPTDKCRYLSRYGNSDTYVTAAQLAAEIMCERKAANRKEELPNKFWNHPAWKSDFVGEKVAADRLLRTFSEEVLIRTLRDKRVSRISTLTNKGTLPKVLKEVERLVDKEIDSQIEFDFITQHQLPRPQVSRKSIVSLLREVEGRNGC